MPAAMRRDKMIYKGSVDMVLLTSQYNVVFPVPMPGPYDIYFAVAPTGINISSVTNVTLNGFTIAVSISLAGTVVYAAVEQMS